MPFISRNHVKQLHVSGLLTLQFILYIGILVGFQSHLDFVCSLRIILADEFSVTLFCFNAYQCKIWLSKSIKMKLLKGTIFFLTQASKNRSIYSCLDKSYY